MRAPAPASVAPPGTRPKSVLSSARFWTLVAVLWAAVLAWEGRNTMNPDGLSYLDIAREACRNGPASLISGYWSPLYPALIAAVIAAARPSPAAEFTVVHFVNLFVFVAVALSFGFFLRGWLDLQRSLRADHHAGWNDTVLAAFSFALFLWGTLGLITLSTVTPDLCVAGVVFLTAGICSRLDAPGPIWARHAALGAVLALGYYAKAAMFPAAILLLVCLAVLPASRRAYRRGVALAALVFVVGSAPLVAVESGRLGGITIGAAGALNYAWFVNQVPPFVGWIEPTPASGAPKHPPRVLIDRPLTLEFASPLPGTCPLWYDPSYWYDGVRPRFDLKRQLAVIHENLRAFEDPALSIGILSAGVAALWGLGRRARAAGLPRSHMWAIFWPAAICAMYVCVRVENRFVGGFLPLFWIAAYSAVAARGRHSARAAVFATVGFALLLPLAYACGVSIVHAFRNERPDDFAIAEALRGLGIREGDALATAGGSLESYYARLAGARVVAQIVDANSLRSMPAAELERVKERLAGTGATALIAPIDRASLGQPGWHEVPGTRWSRFSILMLKRH